MAARKASTRRSTPVKANKHDKDTRTNIPTAELEKFAASDEREPTNLLYPRDPSLDPQLVWVGKDDEDRIGLEVPAVPIYIQETIEPQVIIEDLRRRSKGKAAAEEPTLFADPFEALEFEDRVDFYKHSGKWTNRMVLGDSLLAMASLAEKEGLRGHVQMVYIDPPYGIKFGSNWQVSTRKRDVKDGRVEEATRQPEQVRAFRDTWERGIHSYLSYMRDRLVVSRDLLSESGSIFVQIGDENLHLVRSVMDEVFGSANIVALISFKKTGYQASSLLPSNFDFILWYAKNREQVKFRQLHVSKLETSAFVGQDLWVEEEDGTRKRLAPKEAEEWVRGARPGRVFRHKLVESSGAASQPQPFQFDKRTFLPKSGKHWSTTIGGMEKLSLANRFLVVGNSLRYVNYFDDFPVTPITSNWTDTVVSGFGDPQVYIVQTSRKVVERCLLMSTDPGDLAIDPTCGSGTTAVVAEEWGRRWITIDTSRVALSLARTRIMSAKFPYYLLADSKEGADKEFTLTGHPSAITTYAADIKKGFVYARVPHITLKSIANNPNIELGMTRVEIEAAIARDAEIEILYDMPYEDKKIVRVAGPFTVESLSPHRVNINGPEDEPAATAEVLGVESARFVERIVEELRIAGVQNTYKGEKLIFETLDPYPGVYVQATGTYRESGKSMTAAVALGPEYGTVGKELVREAAKEAAEFADILIICGFAFEALVEDETKVGKLRILKAKMNPDLQMPDLLKKTGAGNLFVVFGEPDVEFNQAQDGMVAVEIRGLDVYDPTTGQVRSGGTDDIACWFIDTDYNEETFFVRQAYFCGGDRPYERLQRALRADVDEAAWSSVYSTKSRPFEKPSTGKFAIKVINHYGDEILKIYEV